MCDQLLDFPRYTMLGVEIQPMLIPDLHAAIGNAVARQRRDIVAHHNLHSVYVFHHDDAMREFYDHAAYTHIDGMWLVLLGRRLGMPFIRPHRVTYVDWVHPLMRAAVENNWRVFFIGGKPGVADRALDRLRSDVPGLQIECAHGYFDHTAGSAENQQRLKHIEEYGTDVLMVGFGQPLQEKWIRNNLSQIRAHAILPCGACMDYMAGAIPTPPRWMGRAGVEWMYRFVAEPRRLWRRYVVEPWFLLFLFIKDWLKYKRKPSVKLVKSRFESAQ